MDELPERLSATLVRPAKWIVVVLQASTAFLAVSKLNLFFFVWFKCVFRGNNALSCGFFAGCNRT